MIVRALESCVVTVLALVSASCYHSSGLIGDAGVDAEVETLDAEVVETDLYVDRDGEEYPVEFEMLPLCDPSLVVNRLIEGCGDGILSEGEECDDGNVLDGDGCTWDCRAGEGTGGIAGPSPLPLTRYCRVDNVIKVADPEYVVSMIGSYGYPSAFWFTGDGYRILYMDREWPAVNQHVDTVRLIAFDGYSPETTILFERAFESAYEESSSVLLASRRGPIIELFIKHFIRDEGRFLMHMAIDENGAVLDDKRILFHYNYDTFSFSKVLSRVLAFEGRTVLMMARTIDDGSSIYESSGVILQSPFPEASVCRFDVENPFSLPYETFFDQMSLGIDGNGSYLTLSAMASNGGFPEEDRWSNYLGIPLDSELPTGFMLRHLCDSSVVLLMGQYWRNGEIVPSGGCFYTFFNRYDYFEPWDETYNWRPSLARIEPGGELISAPTEVFPEGFLLEYLPAACDAEHICFGYEEGLQLLAASGTDTLGVFYVPWCSCGRTQAPVWAPLFQTLDREGRQVGMPCESMAVNSIYDITQDAWTAYVLDIVWDGEGYAVAAMTERGIYFWRYLPEL